MNQQQLHTIQTNNSPLTNSAILQRRCACGKPITANGECADCNKKLQRIQRKATHQQTPETVPLIVHEALRESGRPLDFAARSFMESRFGQDFSNVRVHTNFKANLSAQAINASAYTIGHNIVFGEKQYSPNTIKGKRLLAHELTHVVQQSGRMVNNLDLEISKPNSVYEHEAESFSNKIMNNYGMGDTLISSSKTHQISRQYTSCFEGAAEDFRRSPFCTPPSRIVQPGQNPEKICGRFPGGSTDCEISDEETGELTGRVKVTIDETDPCVRPCVELHEKIHVSQMEPHCKELKACYEDADMNKRPHSDCWGMVIGHGASDECEAYQASVLCLEERLASAPECANSFSFNIGMDVIEGDKCYLNHYCGRAISNSSLSNNPRKTANEK